MRNEQMYLRQDGLRLVDVHEATVVGAGGTGTWVSIFLVMSGCRRIHIMDSDALEASNLNRLPYPPEQIGEVKTKALGQLLTSLRPEIEFNAYPNATEFTLMMVGGSHLFDCTDRFSVQKMLEEHAKKTGMTYIRCSYNGTHMTVTDQNPEWRTPGTPDGYDVTPSWSVPAAICAALGVARAMYVPNLEVSHDLCELYAEPSGEGAKRGVEERDVRNIIDEFDILMHEDDETDEDGALTEDGYTVDNQYFSDVNWESTLREAINYAIRRAERERR